MNTNYCKQCKYVQVDIGQPLTSYECNYFKKTIDNSRMLFLERDGKPICVVDLSPECPYQLEHLLSKEITHG